MDPTLESGLFDDVELAPSASFLAEVRSQLAAETAPPEAPEWPGTHRHQRRTAMVSAAAVVIVGMVGLGVLAWHEAGSTRRVGPGSASDDITAPVSSSPSSLPRSADDPGTAAATPASSTPASEGSILPDEVRIGSTGDDVERLERRLAELGFEPGDVDGRFDESTQQAVWAFKALVLGQTWHDLDATSDASTVTSAMWSRLQEPVTVLPRRASDGTHVEIYLPQQVLLVFTNDRPRLIAHISSGDDQEWCASISYDTDVVGQRLEQPALGDECGKSYTPGGVFKIYEMIQGDRITNIGDMYNPIFFNYDIAIHGSVNVPTHPASHGAVRVTMALADRIPELVGIGDAVYVWGQDGREPESYTARERTPIFNYRDPNLGTNASGSTSWTVPVLTGQDADSARQFLEAEPRDFVVTLEEQPAANVPAGVVISQSPEAGSDLAAGGSITLVVSTGPPYVIVGPLVGLTVDQARAFLTDIGLVVSVEYVPLPIGDVNVGRVRSQEPPVGSEVPPGTTVRIAVGQASPPPTTTTSSISASNGGRQP